VPDVLFAESDIPADVRQNLEKHGHKVVPPPGEGAAQVIILRPRRARGPPPIHERVAHTRGALITRPVKRSGRIARSLPSEPRERDAGGGCILLWRGATTASRKGNHLSPCPPSSSIATRSSVWLCVCAKADELNQEVERLGIRNRVLSCLAIPSQIVWPCPNYQPQLKAQTSRRVARPTFASSVTRASHQC